MGTTRTELEHDVMAIGADIIQSERFAKAWHVPHHSADGSVALHSIETAIYALRIARLLSARGHAVHEEDLVRASLLHDIGMTEDEVFLSPSRIKAHTHPREGARIAREEFGASERQYNAILRHMWPIGHVPPASIEGWILVTADKQRSMVEAPSALRSLMSRMALQAG